MSDQREGQVSGAEQHGGGEQGEQYVVFRIGEEEYAAPILDIQEIIPAGDITGFPNAPAYVLGIINVRGTVATVVSLARLFGLAVPADAALADSYIILTKNEKTLFGMQVDSVSSVMKFEPDKIRPVTATTEAHIDAEYISGVAVVGDRVILILNLHLILKEDEQEKLSAQAVTQ